MLELIYIYITFNWQIDKREDLSKRDLEQSAANINDTDEIEFLGSLITVLAQDQSYTRKNMELYDFQRYFSLFDKRRGKTGLFNEILMYKECLWWICNYILYVDWIVCFFLNNNCCQCVKFHWVTYNFHWKSGFTFKQKNWEWLSTASKSHPRFYILILKSREIVIDFEKVTPKQTSPDPNRELEFHKLVLAKQII